MFTESTWKKLFDHSPPARAVSKISLIGGPCDGMEIDAENPQTPFVKLGIRLPKVLEIPAGGRSAVYRIDRVEDGTAYYKI